MAEDTEETDTPKAKKKSKLPLIIVAVVLLLVVGGGAAYFFLLSGSGTETAEPEVTEIPQEYEMLKLEPFYVNLSETTNYLKLVMSIQYNKTALADILSEDGQEPPAEGETADPTTKFLEEKTPILRDAILALLSSKTLKEVLSLEGKELMKEELVEVLNEALEFEDEVFERVLFQDFLVQ